MRLNGEQFTKKVIAGIGDNGEDLHTGLHYSDLQPGDKWIGLMGSTVKKVEPHTPEHGTYSVHVSHPEHGDSIYKGRGFFPDLAVYRAPKKGGKK